MPAYCIWVVMTFCASALAQTTQSGGNQSSGSTDVETLQTVIVTAEKRKQELQNVPVAVVAFTAKGISQLGANDLQDLMSQTPDVSIPNLGSDQTHIVIRGITNDEDTIGFEDPVSVFVDGVYTGPFFTFNQDIGDVERVEMLYGPQGTLFGKNTIAGAINIITKQPGPRFGGDLEAETGNLGLVRLRGTVNIPFSDDLAANLSVQRTTRGGYVSEPLIGRKAGNIDLTSGRANLLWTPTTNFKLTLSLDDLVSQDISPGGEVKQSLSSGFAIIGTDAPYVYLGALKPTEGVNDNGASVTAEYNFNDGYSLTSISAYRHATYFFNSDDSNSAYYLLVENDRLRTNNWSQELRLTSPITKWYDFVTGLYYYKEPSAEYTPIYSPIDFGVPLDIFANDRIMTQDEAVYAHVNIHVTKRFTLFDGLRYTDEWKYLRGTLTFGGPTFNPATGEVISGVPFIPALPQPYVGVPGVSPYGADAYRGEREWNWESGAQYHFEKDIMAYAKVSTGFKGGGFNLVQSVTTPAYVKPEELTAYEVGMKSALFGNRLAFDIAAFHNDYRDLQIKRYCSGPPECQTPTVLSANAAAVRANGFEINAEAAPIEHLTISAGLSYLDSVYSSFPNAVNYGGAVFNATGKRTAESPPWTFNGAGEYTYPLPNGANLVGHVDFNYTDARYGITDAGQNSPLWELPATWLLNARVGYQWPNGKWEVFLWAQNLANTVTETDKAYSPEGAGAELLNEELWTYNVPRTYGITLDFHF